MEFSGCATFHLHYLAARLREVKDLERLPVNQDRISPTSRFIYGGNFNI